MDIFRRRKRNPFLVPIIVVAAIGLGVLGWYFLAAGPGDDTAAATDAATSEPTPAASREPVPVTIAPAETVIEPTVLPQQVPGINTNPMMPPTPDVTLPATPTPQAAPAPTAPAQTTPAPAEATPAPATTQSSAPAAQAPAGSLIARARELSGSGDPVAARAALNPALAEQSLSPEELRLAMQLQEEINRTLVFSPRVVPGDQFSETYEVKSGDVLQRIAPRYAITAGLLQRVNNISDPRRLRAGQTIKLVKGPFHAVVSKSQFRMDVYLGAAGGAGSTFVRSFPVGLGQDDSTPTGTWQVATGKKLVNPKYYDPRGGGEIEPDDPANPLGEFWIGLTGVGGEAIGKLSYGIHGTIEPDSIGKMASLGCIRMRHDDVALVYDLLVEGKSTVVIQK